MEICDKNNVIYFINTVDNLHNDKGVAIKNTLKVSRTYNISKSMFHILTKSGQQIAPFKNFLMPLNNYMVPNCGMKLKGILKRRCKDCYFVRREDTLYVMCKTFPRHKQMQIKKKEKYTWILTHATQNKIRPW